MALNTRFAAGSCLAVVPITAVLVVIMAGLLTGCSRRLPPVDRRPRQIPKPTGSAGDDVVGSTNAYAPDVDHGTIVSEPLKPVAWGATAHKFDGKKPRPGWWLRLPQDILRLDSAGGRIAVVTAGQGNGGYESGDAANGNHSSGKVTPGTGDVVSCFGSKGELLWSRALGPYARVSNLVIGANGGVAVTGIRPALERTQFGNLSTDERVTFMIALSPDGSVVHHRQQARANNRMSSPWQPDPGGHIGTFFRIDKLGVTRLRLGKTIAEDHVTTTNVPRGHNPMDVRADGSGGFWVLSYVSGGRAFARHVKAAGSDVPSGTDLVITKMRIGYWNLVAADAERAVVEARYNGLFGLWSVGNGSVVAAAPWKTTGVGHVLSVRGRARLMPWASDQVDVLQATAAPQGLLSSTDPLNVADLESDVRIVWARKRILASNLAQDGDKRPSWMIREERDVYQVAEREKREALLEQRWRCEDEKKPGRGPWADRIRTCRRAKLRLEPGSITVTIREPPEAVAMAMPLPRSAETRVQWPKPPLNAPGLDLRSWQANGDPKLGAELEALATDHNGALMARLIRVVRRVAWVGPGRATCRVIEEASATLRFDGSTYDFRQHVKRDLYQGKCWDQ